MIESTGPTPFLRQLVRTPTLNLVRGNGLRIQRIKDTHVINRCIYIHVKVLMYISRSPGDHGDFEYEITGASVQ